MKPPRTIFLKWPFGHPVGEPLNVLQQSAVIVEAFIALHEINKPGEVVDIPYRWRKEKYTEEHLEDLIDKLSILETQSHTGQL